MKSLSSIDFFVIYVIGLCATTIIGGSVIPENATQYEICKTSGCIKAARFILENMDKSINPCDDFYRFACGNYIKKSRIKDDQKRVGILQQADERLIEDLKESLEKRIDESDPRTLWLLKAHYDSCLDVAKIESTSTKILLDILSGLGSWPVLVGDSWDESKFDWKQSMYQLRRIGYTKAMYSLISINVIVDEKNSTRYVINLDQAATELHDYLVNGTKNEIVQAYYKYMVNSAGALGVDKSLAEKELSDSLNFEIELAKISLSADESRNLSSSYNPMTVGELESKYPDIPWTQYINQILHPYHTVNASDRIIVGNPQYLKSMSDLISKTPKRVIANYVVWRVVQESASFLNERFRNIKAEFDVHIKGTNSQPPRSEQCSDYLKDNVPVAVGALYVRKAFDKNLKKEAEKLVEDLRRTFKNTLGKVDWMDEKTRKGALKKLESMLAHVAYPNELLDDEVLDKYFESLKLVPDNHLDSYLSLNLFETNKGYQLLDKPHNKTAWFTHSATAIVNAYYEFFENSLRIAAGFLSEEIFATYKPHYMNYGVLGYYIGHEISHAFDDEGSQYDEDGNLADWWDPKTKEDFRKRAQCIVDQYGNYTDKEVGINLNGVLTEGENIADNVGVKQAYRAYEEYERRNGPEPRLPGLPYSPRQLFWLSRANVYCEKYRPEALKYKITTNAHPPGEFRVIGVHSNMPEFARDFECPLGSFMNPVKKCILW